MSFVSVTGLIQEMTPGSPKDIMVQLYGQPDWSASHFASVYFKFWARVVGSVARKRVLWNTTVIFITNE